MTKGSFSTPQEEFWAGEFGKDYVGRNRGDDLLASNVEFFRKALHRAEEIGSCIELGANIGMNLKAIRQLYPDIRAQAVEINADAARELEQLIGAKNVFTGSILHWKPGQPAELSLIKGVLIHLNPEMLPTAYDRLYEASERLVLLA